MTETVDEIMARFPGTPVPGMPGNAVTPDDDKNFREAVEFRKLKMRVEETARYEYANENAPPMPVIVNGDVFLAEEHHEPKCLIDQLWPTGSKVLLVAQAKTGKTVMDNNILRSLCDGEDFLGFYAPAMFPGKTLLLDFELPRHMAQEWLKEQGIKHEENFAYANLTGQAASFNVMVPPVQKKWAEEISKTGADNVILDCVSPIIHALGLDENRDGRKLCEAIHATIKMGGAQNLLVVHHMGHENERARGDSGFRDWPDMEWHLTMEDPKDPFSARFFSARGRLPAIPECKLEYDNATRHLYIESGGTRADERSVNALAAVFSFIRRNRGCGINQIENGCISTQVPRQAIHDAVHTLIGDGAVFTKSGRRNKIEHYTATAP